MRQLNPTGLLSPHWSSAYLGLPWAADGRTRAGVSCWGLARLVLGEQIGAELPEYGATVDAAERQEIECALTGADTWPWLPVALGEEQPFDLVTFASGGIEGHVGVVAWPGSMLHAGRGFTSRIERYGSDRWKPVMSRFLRYAGTNSECRLNSGASLFSRVNAGDATALTKLDPLDGRISALIPHGMTIEAAIDILLPGLVQDKRNCLRVTIGGHLIPSHLWRSVKPRMWDVVLIRVVPRSDLGRILAQIAVMVAAIATQVVLTPIVGPFFATLASAAIAVGGNLLVNVLFPIKTAANKQIYSVNGFQNQINADGPVPSLLGKLRFAPPYAALPYNETVGDDRYVRALFLVGYGPVSMSDPWIGRVPISNYPDVQINLLQGYPDDPALSLYTQQVLEDADNPVEITKNLVTIDATTGNVTTVPAPPTIRTSAPDCTQIELEFYCPNGLYFVHSGGDQVAYSVDMTLSFRLSGTTDWTDVFFEIHNSTHTAFWRSYLWTAPVRGQYEIKVVRLNDDDSQTQMSPAAISHCTWSAIRSFRPEAPINYNRPMALIEVRAKATGQLNGTIASLSVLAQRICPDYDGATGTWPVRATSNPASLARYVRQGPENTFPLSDGQIDLIDLAGWAEFCNSRGLKYDFYHDSDSSIEDVLTQVCAAGRAGPHDRGDQWTVIIDRTRTEFVDHISPRNSWNFSGVNPNYTLPDAFRVKFPDAGNDYVATERVIPWPGFVGTPQITEDLPLPGKTDPAEIWIEARRRQYQAIYLRDTYTVSQDFEHLVTQRGDGAYLSHDVMDRVQIAGRVRAVVGAIPQVDLTDDAGNAITGDDGAPIEMDGTGVAGAGVSFVILDNPVTMVEGASYNCRFRRSDGQSIVLSIAAQPGTTNTLMISADGVPPDVGDLALFGQVGSVIRQTIVRSIEIGDNLSATLTLVDNNPLIDTLTDAEVPPAWDGRAGGEVGPDMNAPPVPVISSVVSGNAANDFDFTDGIDVIVSVHPGSGTPATAAFDVEHRLHGTGLWIGPLDFPAGEGSVTFTGYASGDAIDVRARAVSQASVPSAWSGTIQHIIAGNDPKIPDIIGLNVSLVGANWLIAWGYQTFAPGTNVSTIVGVNVRYRDGVWINWTDLTALNTTAPVAASPWTSATPDPSVPLYTFAAAAVTDSGAIGNPAFFYISTSGAFLVDDTGGLILDDAGAYAEQ